MVLLHFSVSLKNYIWNGEKEPPMPEPIFNRCNNHTISNSKAASLEKQKANKKSISEKNQIIPYRGQNKMKEEF